MSETDPGVTPDPEALADDPIDELPPVDPPADDDPDKGAKSALVAEREARRAEKAEARQMKAELERLRQQIADKDKSPDEQAIEKVRREALTEAQAAFHERLIRAELKAALTGKVNDTTLALKVIDTSEIDVNEDGEIDPESVTDAIDAALTQYPVLRAADAKKFGGTADQGAKGKTATLSQVTQQELERMTPEQVVAARKDGRLNRLLGVS